MSALPLAMIETDRLVLRAPCLDDLGVWMAFLASERASVIGGPQTDAGQAWRAFAHIAGMWALRGFGSLVFAQKNAPDYPLGACGPWFPIGWPEPELGWQVWDLSAEGNGFAFEAATAARRFAYDSLGWQQPVSYIDPQNARSIALAERLGCTLDPNADTPFRDKCDLVYRHPEVL